MADALATLLDAALTAWDRRTVAECSAKVWHGPGHQSGTHCEIPADEPHEVHVATYGEFSDFGVWKAPAEPHKWVGPMDTFDAGDRDDALMREFELEDHERSSRRRYARSEFIAAYLTERGVGIHG